MSWKGECNLTNNNLLSALCYFSVFFFPLLLPVIIFLVTEDRSVKFHAKRSLISHFVPVILLVAAFIILSFSMVSFEKRMFTIMGGGFDFWSIAPFLFTVIYSLLFFVILVWNVIQGVKVLKVIETD